MENLINIAGAIGLVVALGILAKMHRQSDELLTIPKDITISIKNGQTFDKKTVHRMGHMGSRSRGPRHDYRWLRRSAEGTN
jgi:hypothetical protein